MGFFEIDSVSVRTESVGATGGGDGIDVDTDC